MSTNNGKVTMVFERYNRQNGWLTDELSGSKGAVYSWLLGMEKLGYGSVDGTLVEGNVHYVRPSVEGLKACLLEKEEEEIIYPSLHKVKDCSVGKMNIFTFLAGGMDSRYAHRIPQVMQEIRERIADLTEDINTVKYGPADYTSEITYSKTKKQIHMVKKYANMLQQLSCCL